MKCTKCGAYKAFNRCIKCGAHFCDKCAETSGGTCLSCAPSLERTEAKKAVKKNKKRKAKAA